MNAREGALKCGMGLWGCDVFEQKLLIFTCNDQTIIHEFAYEDSVPMQFDFRSVYGSILMDWFDITEDKVKSILLEDFQYIPILKSTATAIDNPDFVSSTSTLQLHNNYPNPFTSNTTINDCVQHCKSRDDDPKFV